MLYSARLQIVQGHFKSSIFQVHGHIDFAKPLGDNEVRAIPDIGGWTDIWSKDPQALHEAINEYRTCHGFEPVEPIEAPKKIKQTPRRDALKNLVKK